jgi:hypothetical protein
MYGYRTILLVCVVAITSAHEQSLSFGCRKPSSARWRDDITRASRRQIFVMGLDQAIYHCLS